MKKTIHLNEDEVFSTEEMDEMLRIFTQLAAKDEDAEINAYVEYKWELFKQSPLVKAVKDLFPESYLNQFREEKVKEIKKDIEYKQRLYAKLLIKLHLLKSQL